ncbi:hypothetical protein M404DRAFT_140299 [Pisolithus tinctorius Marx 270]|uniref:Retrovirus-related Pol polyprotein from transposon TNT 1-94-like beta-barrel domain-containing protein n=1 Tax=Pisolithus tinctorius Marx 270 TaxID=870435 RepID=A0A0C3PCF0_PISTI|nr:hypothetical protein M404DRAFT_140299 [Pisolithus tinctorius Marx 270]
MAKDDHSLQVPTLNADRSNWLYYKAWVEWAISLKGLIRHLTGLDAKPEDPSAGKDASWKPTATEQKLVSEYLWQWAKDDRYVKQVITVSLLESLFLQVLKEETAKSVWGVLTDLFQNCSCVIAIDLQRKLQEFHCLEKGNVCAHFNKMCTLRKQLATLGQSITDDNFTAIILSSLPTLTILFNSGASHHMSSYHSKFLDYKPIIPKPITAADSHTFHAIRKGDLTIPLPNSTTQTHIQLKDMLYAPKMGITLVSVSKLDVAGYVALF